MPKAGQKQGQRPGDRAMTIEELKAISGNDFAMHVVKDLVFLSRPERDKAVRMIDVVNQTINREAEAPAR